MYKALNIDEFYDKIKKVLEGELPDLTNEAYNVALARDVNVVGKELIDVYNSVMNS